MQNTARDTWMCRESQAERWQRECSSAATDDEVFRRFRTLPAVREVVEGRATEWLNEPWPAVKVFAPAFDKYLPTIVASDSLGGAAPTFEVQPGVRLSATMGFYALDLACLLGLFGSLDGMRIAEIGGGWGGMAAIVTGCCKNVDYTIYDLPAAHQLQRKVLQTLGRSGVTFADTVESTKPFDLCISVCALSELNTDTKTQYAKHVLQKSSRGYLIWNGNSQFREWFCESPDVLAWLRDVAKQPAFFFYHFPRLVQLLGVASSVRYAWGVSPETLTL